MTSQEAKEALRNMENSDGWPWVLHTIRDMMLEEASDPECPDQYILEVTAKSLRVLADDMLTEEV